MTVNTETEAGERLLLAGQAGSGSGTDRELVLAFARALARADSIAMFVDKDNDRDGWASIEQAVESGRCFAIEVADDILAVDCDKPKLLSAIFRLAEQLQLDGYLTVLVNSGEHDHVHLFARISDFDLLSRYKAHVRSLGLDLRDGGRRIRPPLAPHRGGLSPSLRRPLDAREALAALTPRRTASTLSPRMAALLRNGDREGRYNETGKRSAVVMALVTGMVNSQWTLAEAFQALRDPRNRGGKKVQRRSPRSAWKYVAACWQKALEKVASNPAIRDRENTLREIERIRAVVETHPWRGTTGSTDRRVIQAHLTIAAQAGKIVYGASVRQVAELAGIGGLGTVSMAHRRLRPPGGFLILKSGARWRESKPQTWLLRVPRKGGANQNSHISTPLPETVTKPNSQISPRGGDERDCSVLSMRLPNDQTPGAAPGGDLWRRRGLAGNGWRIWGTLSHLPQMPKEIATHLGIHVKTVRFHLKRFGLHRLALHHVGLGWTKGDASPEEVAVTLGVAGARDRQRLEHQRDRERHRQHLAYLKGQAGIEPGYVRKAAEHPQ